MKRYINLTAFDVPNTELVIQHLQVNEETAVINKMAVTDNTLQNFMKNIMYRLEILEDAIYDLQHSEDYGDED